MYFCRDKISGSGFPGRLGMLFRIFEEREGLEQMKLTHDEQTDFQLARSS
jgi:hypothetical protein